MSAAAEVLETPCGRIRITVPRQPGRYYRLEWYEHGGRCQTTAGTTETKMRAKVADVLARLDRDAEPESRRPVAEALEGYLAFMHANHSANHFIASRRELRKLFEPYLKLRCERLEQRHARDALNSSTTSNTARNNRGRINGLLHWGHENGYFSESQTQFLRGYRYSPKRPAPTRPTRKTAQRRSGESPRFVTPQEIPTLEAIVRLGEEFQAHRSWGRLGIELAHSAGVRLGEFFALTDEVVDLERLTIDVDWQILSQSGLSTRRALPKFGKVRTTSFPSVTTTDYEFVEALAVRLDEVEAERKAGTNPKGLLFPASKGGWWWASGFAQDLFNPAAEAAGWERLEFLDAHGKVRHEWVHTMHSLRHRFGTDRINVYGLTVAELMIIGGWENSQVVWDRYYGRSADALESGIAKLRDRTGPARVS